MSSTLELGLALQAAAYREPPLHPRGLALAIVILTSVLLVLSTLIMALRTYTRTWLASSRSWGLGQSWGWEESFSLLGYAFFCASAVCTIRAAFYGLGTRDADLTIPRMIRCAELTLYANIMYGFSMPALKASLVCMLLRITSARRHRLILFAMQFAATAMAVAGILASLLYCHPVRAFWNPLVGQCGNFLTVVRIGYAWTAVDIVTYWTCSLLPWFIIRHLKMPSRAKVSVMLILGLGVLASTATIVRAPFLQYYLAKTDLLYWNGHILLWSQVECGLGLVASSLPALRLLFQRFLETSGQTSTIHSKTVGPGATTLEQEDPEGGEKDMSSENSHARPPLPDQNLNHDRSPPTHLETLTSAGKRLSGHSQWQRIADEEADAKV